MKNHSRFILVSLIVLTAASSRAESDAWKKLRSLFGVAGEPAGRQMDGTNERSGKPTPVVDETLPKPAPPLGRPMPSAPAPGRVVDAARSPEQAAIATLVAFARGQVKAQHAADGLARRDAHAKHHGCVQAKFNVLDQAQLPENLRHGVLQPGARYSAIIRFSNGRGSVKPDSKGDGRGMAVKLLGIPGPKLHPSESGTQDFLMINHPVFFIRSAADYVEFFKASAGGGFPTGFIFDGWLPWDWRWREAAIMLSIALQSPSDMLDLHYFSMVPFRLGPTQNMKYAARPCSKRGKGYPTESDNFMRENLTTALNSESACFDFMVQLQGPGMPIDDATVLWDSKLIPVAKILIEPQSFDSPERMKACENMSYSPWHSVPAHEPLGPINAARLAVYEAVSTMRHELNREPRTEPKPF